VTLAHILVSVTGKCKPWSMCIHDACSVVLYLECAPPGPDGAMSRETTLGKSETNALLAHRGIHGDSNFC
jgi:hypothetical protein